MGSVSRLYISLAFFNQGIGANGTHRSHARCHPYPIPQPVKVGHNTGVYVPYSFRTVVWVILRPTRTDQLKCWSGLGLNPRPPVQQTGALRTELTRRR